MADVITEIPLLIELGEKFTFQNFASKSPRGYPSAYSEGWLVWTHHLSILVEELDKSPIRDSIVRGLDMILLGSGEEDFDRAKNSILSGLRAAQNVFGAPIPASDRTVSLGHNSPEQTQALEKIDVLIQIIEETNDFPGDPEDKEMVLAELSAGRKLIEASKVRISGLAATLKPPLRWVLDKGGGAIVVKAAQALWDMLTTLHWF